MNKKDKLKAEVLKEVNDLIKKVNLAGAPAVLKNFENIFIEEIDRASEIELSEIRPNIFFSYGERYPFPALETWPAWVYLPGGITCMAWPGYFEFFKDDDSYDRKHHRENGPAIIHPNGDLEYYIDGDCHREDGPAVIKGNGSILEYWVKGKRHRDDGPAVIRPDRSEYWVNGSLHRDNGPAIIYADGAVQYWVEGERHRDGGPAVLHSNGVGEYWYHGWQCRGPRNPDGSVTFMSGDIYFYDENGRNRNENGPTIIYADGSMVFESDEARLDLKVSADRSKAAFYGGDMDVHYLDYEILKKFDEWVEFFEIRGEMCENPESPIPKSSDWFWADLFSENIGKFIIVDYHGGDYESDGPHLDRLLLYEKNPENFSCLKKLWDCAKTWIEKNG